MTEQSVRLHMLVWMHASLPQARQGSCLACTPYATTTAARNALHGHNQSCLPCTPWPQPKLPAMHSMATTKAACNAPHGHNQSCLQCTPWPQSKLPAMHSMATTKVLGCEQKPPVGCFGLSLVRCNASTVCSTVRGSTCLLPRHHARNAPASCGLRTSSAHCDIHRAHCDIHRAHCDIHRAHCDIHRAHCEIRRDHCEIHASVPGDRRKTTMLRRRGTSS